MWEQIDFRVATQLLLAAGLGALVGLERELKQKPAGLRTNMFICVGSALFTLLSFQLAERFGGDPVRIAAQLIPGIGFIGAGAIIRERGSVAGVTTAATIFVNAGIGMAVGARLYFIAVFATLLALLVLLIVGWGESRFTPRRDLVNFRLRGDSLDTLVPAVREAARELNISLKRMRSYREGEHFVFEFDAVLNRRRAQELFDRLASAGLRSEMAPVETGRG